MENVHFEIGLSPEGRPIAAGSRVTGPQPGTRASLKPHMHIVCMGQIIKARVRC